MLTPHTMVQFAPSVAPRLTTVSRYSSLRETNARERLLAEMVRQGAERFRGR